MITILREIETYSIDEFATSTWSDRKEYSSDDIGFDHIKDIHRRADNFAEFGRCGKTNIWYFLTIDNDIVFEYFLYQTNSWTDTSGDQPISAEPVLWIYGTSFDGVREMSGGSNFSCDPRELANALKWVFEFSQHRWPSFKKWYDND